MAWLRWQRAPDTGLGGRGQPAVADGEEDGGGGKQDGDRRATFDRMLAVVGSLGEVEVLAEQTRIALHARMSFAAFMPRRRWLAGHLVLARRIDSSMSLGELIVGNGDFHLAMHHRQLQALQPETTAATGR